MSFHLGPEAAAAGYRLESFAEIGSTNPEAMARARAGDPGRLWLVTGRQTAGRGRRGRAWSMPAGNLAASCLMLVESGREIASFGFVAGLSLHTALVTLSGRAAGETPFRLKWPNDVLVGEAKLSGILLEAELVGDRMALVTGIGVNVAAAPEGLEVPVAAVTDVLPGLTATDVFAALSDAWLVQAGIWLRDGFAGIRDRWLDAAAGLGEPVAVRTDNGVERGVFETIDATGRLVVRRDDRSTALVTAGDVYFGTAATLRSAD